MRIRRQNELLNGVPKMKFDLRGDGNIFFIGEDLHAPGIEVGDIAKLYLDGQLIEATIKSKNQNDYEAAVVRASVDTEKYDQLEINEIIKFREKNIFGIFKVKL